MSFGVDFGNALSVVGVPKAGGISVMSNEVSKRETSSMVSFGDKERYLGEKALDQAIRNWRNTVSSIKRLIGVEYGSAAFDHEKKYCKFEMRPDENNLVEIKVKYKWEDVWFKPEQVLGMLFTRLRSYVEADAAEDIKLAGGAKKEVRIPDCVVSVPAFFTDLQRRLVWQGLQISDLNPLSLMNETTAAALDYGIYKSANLPEKEEDAIVVAIIDIGHAATTASLVSFTKTQLKVLGHVFDPFLGGREFDYALYEYYKAETEKKHHYDMDSDKKSQIRLLNACEKLKKVLSANAVANLTCELTEKDVSFPANREDTEKLWVPLLDRMRALVQKLEGMPNFSRLSSVELIGGGIRVPAVKNAIAEALGGRTLSTTLNTSESIAKGCSIMAAMLSPNFKVREYTVIDSNVYTVALGYHSDKGGAAIHPQFPELNKKMIVLKPGEACPKTLNLTFERTQDFELCVFYDENPTVAALNSNPLIGKWKVAKIPQVNSTAGVKVRLRLAPMMTVSIEGATVSEEVEEEEEYEVEVDEDAAPTEGGEQADGEKKEGEKKEEKPKQKKKVKQRRTVKRAKKHECAVETLFVKANPQEKVKEYADREKQMIQSDANVRDTQEAKNSVESWIYDIRSKIAEGGQLFEFSQPDERERLQPILSAGEDWLYGEGEDTSKEDYVEKLKELKKAASSITQRYQDHLDAIRKAKEEEERKKKEEADRQKKEEEDRKKKAEEEKKAKEAEEKAKAEGQAAGGEAKPAGDKMDLD